MALLTHYLADGTGTLADSVAAGLAAVAISCGSTDFATGTLGFLWKFALRADLLAGALLLATLGALALTWVFLAFNAAPGALFLGFSAGSAAQTLRVVLMTEAATLTKCF